MSRQRPFHLVVYSDATQLGGAETTLGILLAGLPDHVRVSIVCVNEEVGRWLSGRRPGTTATVLEPISSRGQVREMLATRRALRRLRPDIVQFNLSMASSCQWAIAVAATIRGIDVVVVENASMGTWSAASSRLKRLTARRVAAHLAVGDATARAIEASSGLPRGSIETMYHGVPDVSRDAPREPGAIVHVGRHDPVKAIDVLLEAMVAVDPTVRLVQIGDGELKAGHVALSERLGLSDRVEFRDVEWTARVGDLLSGFELFVLPSRTEGLPVSIMEAMLAGLPIIATDVGSVREEVVEGENAVLVPPDDPRALAAAINELMGDPSRRESMGRRSRELALDRFTADAMVGRYLSVYDRLLSEVRNSGDPPVPSSP